MLTPLAKADPFFSFLSLSRRCGTGFATLAPYVFYPSLIVLVNKITLAKHFSVLLTSYDRFLYLLWLAFAEAEF